MIDKISAAVLFVRDLARCTTFYRDTLGLQAVHSDPTSVAFHMEDQDFLLLEVGAAAHMLSEDALELKSEGSQRVLLCVPVLRMLTPRTRRWWPRESGFSDLQPTNPGGCAQRTLSIPRATSGRSTGPFDQSRSVAIAARLAGSDTPL